MHVFLTGATGFVGAHVLQTLHAAGHTARCLVRDPSTTLSVDAPGIEKVKGDVTQPRSLTGTVRGCDAVIHLVGIIEERPSKGVTFEAVHDQGTRHMVAEAKDAEVQTFIHMSANGARQDGVSAYQTTKWRGEQHVRKAGFARWTIFRPSIVFGDPGPDRPEFATQLARDLVKPFPVLPIFGDGSFQMQPVAVEAVAAAFVQALTREAAAGKAYCVAGPEALPFTELLDRIAQGLGHAPKLKIPTPTWLVRPVVQTLDPLHLLPLSSDQLEMLLEGNTCDASAFYADFDVPRTPFTPENLRYLAERA